jgi:hypothetical protein
MECQTAALETQSDALHQVSKQRESVNRNNQEAYSMFGSPPLFIYVLVDLHQPRHAEVPSKIYLALIPIR